MEEEVGNDVLATQLRKARQTLEFNLQEVAKELGVRSQELADWEQARAEPSLKQLEQLAELYGRDIDFFLRMTPSPAVPQQFRVTSRRSLRDLSWKARQVISRFDELCRVALDLENVLARKRVIKVERARRGPSATALALDQRQALGFDNRPIRDLRNCLEEEGIRIFLLPVPPPGEFSGFSCWHDQYGPCILVNSKDIPGRRNFTLAHEYAHIIYDHGALLCEVSEAPFSGLNDEQMATDFAVEFLMPAEGVRNDFGRRGLSGNPSGQEVGRLAGKWQVSVQAMAYRLEELGLVRQGFANQLLASWEPLPSRFGRGTTPRWETRLGKHFVSLGFDAYAAGHISLGKFAHCLGLPVRKALEIAGSRRS